MLSRLLPTSLLLQKSLLLSRTYKSYNHGTQFALQAVQQYCRL